MRRTLVSVAAAAASCLAIAAPASASSIVYVKGGNVWLSSPDGSVQRQVTTDGGYRSPSQADDGNIVAIENGLLVHMDRRGHSLNAPVNGLSGVSGGTTAFGAQDARVSPDDSRIAYDVGIYSQYFDWSTNSYQYRTAYQTLDTAVNEFTDPSVDGIVRDYSTPSWIDSHTMLLTATGIGIDQFALHELGGGDNDPQHFQQWFSDNGSPLMSKAQLTRSQDTLVTLAGNAQENIGIYSFPATGTPTLRCVINEPPPGTHYDDPTWSPDGTELAYAKPDGVYVTAVGNIAGGDCSSIAPKQLIAGGSEPFWGPADVSPADGYQAPGTPSGTPSTPHTPNVTNTTPPSNGSPSASGTPASAKHTTAPAKHKVAWCTRRGQRHCTPKPKPRRHH
jgi:hypothetical protein